MPKSRTILGVFVALGLAGAAQAGPKGDSVTPELRQKVLDWLETANEFEFQGTIEFTKRLRLPSDPDRAYDVKHAREEIERCKEQYARQLSTVAGVEGDEAERLRETVSQNHERSLAQYQDMIRYFEAWSTTGIEVEQHWSVIYVTPENIRVEFLSETLDPPVSALIPVKQVHAVSNGRSWSWSGLSTVGLAATGVRRDMDDPFLVRQAQDEVESLLAPLGRARRAGT